MEGRLSGYTDAGVMTAVAMANGYTDDEINVGVEPDSITATELASGAVIDAKI